MKMVTKQLLAAVHGVVLRTHTPCDYVKHPPISGNSYGLPIWGCNPKTGVEYELECVVNYDYYAGYGKSYSDEYDPPSVESLSVWHYRSKIGMWHEIDISRDTEKYICDAILEREAENLQSLRDEIEYQKHLDREEYDYGW